MKLLVLSDSHGAEGNILTALDKTTPDALIFLGDGLRDIWPIMDRKPDFPCYFVRGNCDFGYNELTERMLGLAGHTLFICHGHTFGVKSGTYSAEEQARALGADVLLYGHTHRPFCELKNGLWVMNPGSCEGRSSACAGIVLLETAGIVCYNLWINERPKGR